MKRILFLSLIALSLFPVKSYCQNNNIEEEEDVPFAIVEQSPTFQGKDASHFISWVHSQLKYPQEAVKDKLEGKVHVYFVVNKEGKVKNVDVLKGANKLLAAEAIRVVSSSSDWVPGKMRNKSLDIPYIIPVLFDLNGNGKCPELELVTDGCVEIYSSGSVETIIYDIKGNVTVLEVMEKEVTEMREGL